MRFAYMDVGEGREQDAEASLIDTLRFLKPKTYLYSRRYHNSKPRLSQ